MEPQNFLITGVGGQGTLLAGDILATVGLQAGYDVKKSDTLGLAVRGGAVVGHIRWGNVIHSPIVPEGLVDFLVAFEILEGLRQLHQVRLGGAILINQQEIHPVTVSSGLATYPNGELVDRTLDLAAGNVYRIPALKMAQVLGDARILNIVLLGALSCLLSVSEEKWERALKERVPSGYLELNKKGFYRGREWMMDRRSEPCAYS